MKNFTQTTFQFRNSSFTRFATALSFLFVLLSSGVMKAQTAASYSNSRTTTGSLALDLNSNTVDMTTGFTTLAGTGNDMASTVTNLGFTFVFGGTSYTQFSTNSNGFCRLGGTVIAAATKNLAVTGNALITPFGEDLYIYGTVSGSNTGKLIGTSPNRCYVIQWANMNINTSSASADGTFQLRLYEGTNKIEFVYGAMKVASTFAQAIPGARIGFSNGTTDIRTVITPTTYQSPSSIAAANVNNYGIGNITDLNSSANGSRVTYVFAPVTYTSVAATDWNTASTWSVSTGGNGVPTAGSTVIVNTNVTATTTPTNQVKSITVNSGSTLTLNGAYTNASGSTVTVASGGTLAVGATYTNSGTTTITGTFQINNSGWATGSGTWTYTSATGTLAFGNTDSNYTINSSDVFWPNTSSGPYNVTVSGNGGINLGQARTVPSAGTAGTFQTAAQVTGSALTFTGTCQINPSGYFTTTPTYGAASTLVYNTGSVSGTPYGVASEWTGSAATAGVGIPNNVTIQGNTFITMPNGNRGMSGALNVTAGSGITLNATSGDLGVGGNFTQNGTLTHSGRAVNFFGTSATTQTITGTGLNTAGATNCFAYFLNNTSGTGGVTIGTNVTISATAGSVLQLLNSGPLKIGAFTLTLDGNGGDILTSGGARVIDFSSASGKLLIKGTTGILKTVTSATGTLSVTSSEAGGQLQVQGGGFNPGSALTTIQTGAFMTINSNGYIDTNSPTYAAGSTLSFRNGGTYGVGNGDDTWAIGASGAGVPDKVEINAAGTNVTISENRTARTSVTVTAGTLTNNTNTLSISTGTSAASAVVINGGTYTNGGGTTTIGNNLTTTSTNALTVSSGTLTNSSGTINVVNTGTTASSAVLISGGTYNNSGGTLNIGNASTTVAANGALTISSGSLTNTSGTITIAALNTTTSSTVVNITGSGTLTNSGGTLNVGPTNGGNQSLTLGGGTLTINNGTVAVNGTVALTTGVFNMSNGNLNIDANSGVTGSSAGAGADILGINSSVTGTVNGGTILINDPLFAGTTGRALAYTGTTASRSWDGNTVQFGGATGNASTSTNGFNVDTSVSSVNLQLGNVIANGGAVTGTRRFVSGSVTAANGFDIGGNLTINASSEVRTIAAGTVLRIKGNIVNNGTLTDITGIAFNQRSGTISSNTSAQTVSGSGTFRNLTASPTAKFTNLTFDNTLAAPAAAVTFSIGDVTATGTVTLTNGIIDIGNNNSFNFVGTASSVARTSGYVLIQGTGQMKKDLATGASSFTFHVGENTGTTEYSPYSLSFSANSLARTIGVRPVDANHPNLNDVDTQTDYISRYWQLSNSAAGTYTYTATATYVANDIVGTETEIKMGLWNGTSPWKQATSSAASNVLTISTGVTNVSAPLGATAEFTGRVKGSNTYTWNQTGSASYTVTTNWTPERTTPAANDILVFDGALTPTPIVTNFASETISQLLFTNNANVNLQPAATATLTIKGGSGTDLDIPSGSTLNLSGGASVGLAFLGTTTTNIAGTLTFSSTVGTPTLNLTNTIATVTGTINLSSTTNATITSSSTILLMNSGSFMNLTNGTTIIPLATWDTNSNLVFSGSGTSFSNNTQSFGNFNYNSSVITATVSFFTTTTTAVIKGNFNISNTGTGKFRTLTTGTLAVNGNINVSNTAIVDLISGAASLNVTGNVNVSNTATLNFAYGAGTINIGGSVTTSDAAIINFGNTASANRTNITGNLNLNSSATSVLSLTSGTTQIVDIVGNFNQTAGTFSMGTGTGASTLKVAGSFTAISLNNAGTGTANLIDFYGTSSQAVSPGASVTGIINFRVSNPTGIAVTGTLPLNNGTTFTAASSGTAVTSGTVTYGTTTTLAYVTAVGAQTTGNEFPSTSGPVNVTFNNTFVTTPEITLSGSGTVSGTLTITAGRVLLGNNDLTLANGGTQTITTPETTKMIVTNGTGLYKRGIPATAGAYLFPIGDNSGSIHYSPVTLQFTANSAVRIVGAKAIDAASSNLTTGGTPTNYLSRYWTFSENGAGGTYNYYLNPAVATTGAEDENGTASLIKAAYWDGSTWTTSTGSYTTGSLVSNATGVSETAAPLGSVEWTGRDAPAVSYTWVGFTNGSWNTGTNWSPNGVPSSSDSVTLANGSTGAAANLNLTTAVTVNNLTFDGSGNFFSVGASPAAITALGNVTYTGGTGSWNATSTFTISSTSSQTIPAFAYGNLTGTGGARVWTAGTTSIAGTFTPGAGAYTATAGSTVDYNGAGAQTIGSVNYYNLTNSGNGVRTLVTGTIDVANSYTPTTATTTPGTANVFNFSSASAQTIPASSYARITNTGNGNRTLANSGTITIAGTLFTPGSGTYTVTGSTVALTSTTGFNLTLPTVSSGNSFNVLTINGTGGTFALPYAATTQNLANTLNIQAGTFVMNPSTNTTSLVNNIAVGTVNLSGGTLDDLSTGGLFITTNLLISTAWNQTGGLATVSGAGFAEIIFTGGGATSYTGLTPNTNIIYYFVQVSDNTTLSLASNLAINGINGGATITLDAGSTIDANTFILSTSGTTNTFLINGTFKTSNTNGFSGSTTTALNNITNTPTITLGANSTVEYTNASATQTVTNRTDYANLTLTGLSKTIGATALTLSKNLTINSGATYNGAANPALTIGGNFLNSGTFTQGTGLLTFNGTSPQTVGGNNASTFNNVTVSGTDGGLSLGNSQTIDGILTLSASSGGNIDLNGNNNITLGATASITGETCSRQFINSGSPTQGNGYVQTTRTLAANPGNVANLGLNVQTATAMGSTNIKRFVKKGISSVGLTNSVKRTYTITPTTAATGNVTLTSSYCDGELNSNTESTPALVSFYGTGTDETTGYSDIYGTASNDATGNTVTSIATASLIAGQNNITLANAGPDAYYTVQDGDWNTASTWVLNAVPPAGVATIIKNAVTVTGTVTNAPSSITINTGKSLTFGASGSITTTNLTNNGSVVMTDGGVLTITSGGTFANGTNTFTSGTGTLAFSSGGATTGSITIAIGAKLSVASGTLNNTGGTLNIDGTFQINQGGFASGGTWNYGTTGTLVYNNTSGTYGPIDGNHSYWPSSNSPINITVLGAGGINLDVSRTVSGIFQTSAGVSLSGGAVLTLNGTCQINANGFFNNAPTYGGSSTLIYNTGGTYGRGSEWNALSGAGYPANVQIGNGVNTTLNVVNNDNSFKKASGNLTVSAGSTFSIDGLTAQNGSTGVGVEFVGNLINSGNITLSGTTNKRLKGVTLTNNGTITLAANIGADLELSGNYTDNATFVANQRAVFFTGTGTQTISGTATAPFNIDYIVINKPSGIVQLGVDLLTGAPNGGNGITLSSSSDIFDLNGKTFTLGSAAQTCTVSGSGLIRSASNNPGTMIINGTGAMGTLTFETANNTLAGLTINRTSGTGTAGVTLGSALNVTTSLALTSTTTLTLGGTLTVSASTNNTVAGKIAGTGALVKTGSGTLTLTAANGNNTTNTYSVGTTVDGAGTGTIAVTGLTNITSASIASDSQSVTFSTTTPTDGTYQLLPNALTVGTQNFTHNAAPTKAVTFNYSNSTITVGPATITTSAISPTTYCAGAAVTISFTTNGPLSGTYTAQLSDATGSFTSPVAIGTSTTNTISGTIPLITSSGTGYRIRVVNIGNSITGSDNGTNITVNANLPASVSVTASPGGAICTGTSVTFTASPTNGGATPAYQWYVGATPVGTNSATFTSTTLANNDVVTVQMTSNASPCLTSSPATSTGINMTVNANLPASVSVAASPSGAICTGTSVTFTATPTNGGSTPAYQWLVNSLPVSGETASTFTSTTLANNDVVTVQMTSNASPCLTSSPATSTGINMIVPTNITWVGTNGNWNTASNWSCGTVPTAGDTIIISSGTPTLDSNFTVGSAGSLTLNGTASLIINSTASLTVAGTAAFNAIPITFKSDASGTAAFGEVTGTVTGATNVTVERHFPAKRAFRFATSAVTTTTSIKSNWQEGVNNADTVYANNQNPYPGYGTHITGTGGSTNGFDTTVSNSASMFGFNNTTAAWVPVANTTNNNFLTAGTPYRINIRGSRSVDMSLASPAASATTLRANGALAIGTVSAGTLSSSAYAYNFIGNPYQAPVNMKTALDSATNLNNVVYYVWDPRMNTRGAYISVDLTSTNGTPNNQSSGANKFLQPGQACFIRTGATAGSASLNFQESYKVVGSPNTSVFRADTQNTTALSTIKLRLFDSNSLALNLNALDGLVVFFDDAFSSSVDQNDGGKFANPDEMLSTFNNGALISIEKRQHPTAADIIPLRASQYRVTDYTMVAEGTNLNGVPAYLHDQFLQTYTEIPQSGVVNYPFNVATTNTQTTASDRFRIVYTNPLLNTNNTEWMNFTMYPNPSKQGNFNIILPQQINNAKVTIYTTLGKEIYTQNIDAALQTTITPKQQLATGIYYVVLEFESNKSVKKLIIE